MPGGQPHRLRLLSRVRVPSPQARGTSRWSHLRLRRAASDASAWRRNRNGDPRGRQRSKTGGAPRFRRSTSSGRRRSPGLVDTERPPGRASSWPAIRCLSPEGSGEPPSRHRLGPAEDTSRLWLRPAPAATRCRRGRCLPAARGGRPARSAGQELQGLRRGQWSVGTLLPDLRYPARRWFG